VPNIVYPARSYRGVKPPLEVPGLQFYSDALSPSNYTTSGGSVTAWNDLSGKTNNASSAGSGTGVTVNLTGINGLPALQFSGGKYLAQSNGVATTAPRTLFFIYQADSIPQTGAIFGGSGSNIFNIGFSSTAFSNANQYALLSTQSPALSSCLNAAPGNPEIVVCTVDPVTNKWVVYQNGMQTSGQYIGVGNLMASAFSAGPGAVPWQIGAFNGGANFTGKIGALGYAANGVSPATALSITQWLATAYGIKPYYVMCDGDSLTGGYNGNAYPSNNLAWPSQFLQLCAASGKPMWVFNNGYTGIDLVYMNYNASTPDGNNVIDNFVYPNSIANEITLVVWGGTNDISSDSQTAAQTYARLVTYVTNRAATGKYKKICVVTCIPRNNNGGVTTAINFAYNALITAGMQSGGSLLAAGATHLCDPTQLSQFNSASSVLNTTYYLSDYTHLTQAGYALIAGAVKATLGY
jgi:lysophospholipase L1-like esterase